MRKQTNPFSKEVGSPRAERPLSHAFILYSLSLAQGSGRSLESQRVCSVMSHKPTMPNAQQIIDQRFQKELNSAASLRLWKVRTQTIESGRRPPALTPATFNRKSFRECEVSSGPQGCRVGTALRSSCSHMCPTSPPTTRLSSTYFTEAHLVARDQDPAGQAGGREGCQSSGNSLARGTCHLCPATRKGLIGGPGCRAAPACGPQIGFGAELVPVLYASKGLRTLSRPGLHRHRDSCFFRAFIEAFMLGSVLINRVLSHPIPWN